MIAALCGVSLSAGCATDTSGPLPLERYSLRPATGPRGSQQFCTQYAANTFATTFQLHQLASSDAWAKQQARVSADAAYARCRSGRTN